MIKILVFIVLFFNLFLVVGVAKPENFTHSEFRAENDWMIELSDNSLIAFSRKEEKLKIAWQPSKTMQNKNFLNKENIVTVSTDWQPLEEKSFDKFSESLVKYELDEWEQEKNSFEKKEEERFSLESAKFNDQKIKYQTWLKRKKEFEEYSRQKFEEENNQSFEEALRKYNAKDLLNRVVTSKPELKAFDQPAPKKPTKPKLKESFGKPRPVLNKSPAYDFWGLVFYLSRLGCRDGSFRVRYTIEEYDLVLVEKSDKTLTTTWGQNKRISQCRLEFSKNMILDIYIDEGRFAGMKFNDSVSPLMVQKISSPSMKKFEMEHQKREFTLSSMQLRKTETIQASYFEANTNQNLDLVYQLGKEGNPEVRALVPKNFYLRLNGQSKQRISKLNYFKLASPEGKEILVLYRLLNLPIEADDLKNWDLIAQVEHLQHRGALHNILTYIRKEKAGNQKSQATGVNYLFDGISILYWPVWATLHKWNNPISVTFFDDKILQQNLKLTPKNGQFSSNGKEIPIILWSLSDSNDQKLFNIYVGKQSGIIHSIEKPLDGHSYKLQRIDTPSIRKNLDWRTKEMKRLKIVFATPLS